MDQELFLKMINAAIKGEYLDLSTIDEDFIRVAKEQTFQPMLYSVTKNRKYKSYYIQASLIHDRFMEVGKLVDKVLTEASIPHIFIKGYDLQRLYPDPILRMMGDIDVLVDEEYKNQSYKIFIEKGFIYHNSSEHDNTFMHKGIEVEVHFSLCNKTNDNKNYFNKKIKDFSNEYYFLYLINHYAKHFKSGAGLREVIDFYLLLKNNTYDYNIIISQVKVLGYLNFLYVILNEIELIFGEVFIPYERIYDVKKIINFSLKSGIHGFGERSNHQSTILSSNNKCKKFTSLVKIVFIPRKKLQFIYPWAKFILLIPFAYFVRFLYLIFKKHKKLIAYVKTTRNEEEYEMFNSIFK